MKIKITPQQLNGTIEAIPSKSHAHRLLIAQKLASLQGCGQETPLVIPTFSEDIDATKGCLAQLDQKLPCFDCRESGSTIRFLIPVAMALKDETVFAGSGKLPQRPLSPLKEEMERHGCKFEMLTASAQEAAKPSANAIDTANTGCSGSTSIRLRGEGSLRKSAGSRADCSRVNIGWLEISAPSLLLDCCSPCRFLMATAVCS